jgi:hypothetical protein
MLSSVAVAVVLEVLLLTLTMEQVTDKRSLVVMVELVVIKTLTLKLFLVHTTLQSVVGVLVLLQDQLQLLELQQLVLV